MRKRANREAVADIGRETGGLGSLISRHPREFVGIVMASAAVFAIFANALYLQKGPHPAPIFATRQLLTAAPPVIAAGSQAAHGNLAPPDAAQSLGQVTADIQRELIRRGFYDGAPDGIWGAKTDAGVRDFLQAAGLTLDPEPSVSLLRAIVTAKASVSGSPAAAPEAARIDPIAALIAPSKRVLAIQRALSDFGYGQIKATGTYGPDTRAAIEKFERDHRLPVSGQITDRFVRELAAMTGRPLE